MRIEHIALYTEDLERMRRFYMDFFNAGCNQGYHNKMTGLRTYFLTFEDSTRLEIMTRPEMPERRDQSSRDGIPGYAHLAFSVGSRDKVDSLTKALEQAGCLVASRPRITGDGYYESGILDPDGNYIELTE